MSTSKNGNLVLSRKAGQAINIYAGTHKIVVTRLECDKIGFQAEKCVRILRGELELEIELDSK